MSNAQAERGICQLYESDSLRSELRDEEASLLLMWGEARLSELAARNLPDEQFDHLAEKLRSLLTNVNLCVGKRKTAPSQHLSLMASIGSAAEAAGFVLTPDDQTTFLSQQGVLTNQDAISELLGLLKTAEVLPVAQALPRALVEAAAPPPSAIVAETGDLNAPTDVSQPMPAADSMPVPPAETVSEPDAPSPAMAAPEALPAEPPQPMAAPDMSPAPAQESNSPPQPEDLPEMPPQEHPHDD